MDKEDMGMSELMFGAICFVVLALCLIIRLIKGPTAADRAISANCIDILADMALILYALYTGRGIFLDIALVTAILGFIGTVIIARYLEGRL